jgi:uncharacterized repeat protein (TIGR02543 family)
MKQVLYSILALLLALGLAVGLGGCPAADESADDPALIALSDEGTTTIYVDNGHGVTGGTEHGFCSEDSEEWEEWHFVLVGLNSTGAIPAQMTVVFADGAVDIGLEVFTGIVAHYRLPGYLTATLVNAYADVVGYEGHIRFNLSHAPCGGSSPEAYTLTVNIVGSGSVAKAPDQATYTHGTSVQLTASAAPGWAFAGWSGDLSGMTNPDSITMDGNKTVTATFTQYQYTLTVSIVGSGSVAKAPDQATYTHGTSVQLTATADPGWTFAGWSDDLTGTTSPATITMDGDKTVTATFTQYQSLPPSRRTSTR